MVNGKFESFTVPIPPSRITAFLEDLDHSLWIATDGFGVFRLQNGTVRSYSVTDGLPDNRIVGLYRDHAGRIWTAGWKGISSWDGVRFVANEAVNADVSEAISCFEDRDRNLWVGSTSGLLRVRGLEVARTDRSTGLSSDFVDDVFEDREGNLWVGSRTGLDRLRNDQIQSIGLPGPVVSYAQGILTASDGQILRVAANGVRQVPVSLPKGTNVFTVLSRPDAGLLVGTDKGALIWTGKHIRAVPELSKLSIRSMLQDRDGSIWIGTANRGLLHWNPSAGSRSLTETGVPDKWIITLAQDHTGALWAGSFSGGGLYRLDSGKVQHFGRDEGFRSTVIYSVYVDRQGELWIGSADGLSWFQDGAIRTVNSQQGLPADQVFAILDDSFNRIWLGGQIGITVIDKKSLSEWASGVRHKLEPVLYPFPRGVESGFSIQFFPNAARSTDGHLWFGGMGGLCEVMPSNPAVSQAPQFPVLIEDVTVDSVLHSANGVIGMPPGTRSIEVRYTALTLSNAEAVRFRYRLEGMDKDWVDADTRRLAFYDNLKPGAYKFRVAARVGEEQWQESSTVMLEQLPFFYQTWWFILLCAAAFLAVLWTLYQQRLHIVRQQYAAGLEATVGERMRVARELHDTLLQSFQGVAFQLQAARKLFLRKADNAEAALDEAIQATEEAIQEGRSAIRDLRPEPAAQRDLPELLNVVGNELATAHEGNGHSPSYRVVVEGKQQDLSPMLQDEVYRVSREVIRNAFTHAAASHIEVEIRYDQDQLRLRVRDDGKGIDPKVLAGGQSGHFGIPGIAIRNGTRYTYINITITNCSQHRRMLEPRSLTIMILGDVCTRSCRFCDVPSGRPQPPDSAEPDRVANLLADLDLCHAVITCVNRDDCPTGARPTGLHHPRGQAAGPHLVLEA